MKTELRILEEGPKVEIQLDALKATLKRNAKLETPWPI